MSGFSFPVVPGQVRGTATNDNASAGNVGEYVSSAIGFASRITLTGGVAANVTSISLTAGDWDVSGSVVFAPAATTNLSAAIGGISLTSATLDQGTAEKFNGVAILSSGQVFGATSLSASLSPNRISISTTTTVYLIAYSTFTVAANQAWGTIMAWRAR